MSAHKFVPPVTTETTGAGSTLYVARCKCGFVTKTYCGAAIAAGVCRTHATKGNRRA